MSHRNPTALASTALRVLLANLLKEVVLRGDPSPLAEAAEDARALRITSADGHAYSGVLVVHQNVVTTGAVVVHETSAAPIRAPHVVVADTADAVGSVGIHGGVS